MIYSECFLEALCFGGLKTQEMCLNLYVYRVVCGWTWKAVNDPHGCYNTNKTLIPLDNSIPHVPSQWGTTSQKLKHKGALVLSRNGLSSKRPEEKEFVSLLASLSRWRATSNCLIQPSEIHRTGKARTQVKCLRFKRPGEEVTCKNKMQQAICK